MIADSTPAPTYVELLRLKISWPKESWSTLELTVTRPIRSSGREFVTIDACLWTLLETTDQPYNGTGLVRLSTINMNIYHQQMNQIVLFYVSTWHYLILDKNRKIKISCWCIFMKLTLSFFSYCLVCLTLVNTKGVISGGVNTILPIWWDNFLQEVNFVCATFFNFLLDLFLQMRDIREI